MKNSSTNNYCSMEIDHINDIDEFFNVVDRCAQPVYMDDSENAYDLKNDMVARRVMRSVCRSNWRGLLNLHVGRSDMSSVIGYMMGQ